jgi:hypothetical protein
MHARERARQPANIVGVFIRQPRRAGQNRCVCRCARGAIGIAASRFPVPVVERRSGVCGVIADQLQPGEYLCDASAIDELEVTRRQVLRHVQPEESLVDTHIEEHCLEPRHVHLGPQGDAPSLTTAGMPPTSW